MQIFSRSDLLASLPLLFLVAWASILLLVTAFAPQESRRRIPLLSALGLLATGFLTFQQLGSQQDAFGGMYVVDGFSLFLNILLVLSGLLAIALSTDYLQRMEIARKEYYVLMLFSISGMMLMASAADLIVVFLALELLSIPLYVLAAFGNPDPKSERSWPQVFLARRLR
jgi:NADH-quinone oxidoreductase subunit N